MIAYYRVGTSGTFSVCGRAYDSIVERDDTTDGEHVTVLALQSRGGQVDNLGRIEQALDLAWRYSQIDGAHHKAWVIDQMVRILAGDDYERIIREHNAGEDGPNTYTWDVGIAP